MMQEIFIVLGGIGMFLLGMDVMTTALREAAGSNLRGLLSQFTTTPLRGVVTGAATTALIQSSSATTVMTVGFVGAGLMHMPQALGIIYGANIGTTATGWLVSLLGFKLQLETIAMVTLLPASLAVLLAPGQVARAGRIVAGLCLLLIGLDMMQAGMQDVTRLVTPQFLPGETVLGLLALVGIGLAVTVLIQSSSAAVALALVMLQSGAISLTQAAAIVVGMNIGTTFTAILASVGGSRAMRQTAVANLAFNLATSAMAFPLLLIGSGVLVHIAQTTGPLTALLLFHTGFNLIGTAVFLPLTPQFTRAITRLVPDQSTDHLIDLDRGVLGDAGAALITAQAGAAAIAQRQFSALSAALTAPPDYRSLSALEPGIGVAIDKLEVYLFDIRLPPGQPAEEEVYSDLLHQADHLRRLLFRCQQKARIQTLLEDRTLRRPAHTLGAILNRAAGSDSHDLQTDRLGRLQALVTHRTNRHRRGLLLGEHAGIYSVQQVFAHTDAMRWLQRTLHHAERIGHYDRLARDGLQQQMPRQAG
ncbi:MAG: phosphate:Na+ symporter [Paracoccaceae bacterium]|jgi:phosphate:Na+ symporter